MSTGREARVPAGPQHRTSGVSDATPSSTAAQTAFAGVIAVDGPSGTGKSTVARLLAARIGAQYLDTGAMYRAATVAALRSGIDLADSDAIARVVTASRIGVSVDPQAQRTTLDGVDVSAEIRNAGTTAAVSAVSAVPAVRTWMVQQQRDILARRATVAEGRDIGSVVWPQAELKVYLTASEQVRAARRAGELGRSGNAELAEVAESIRRRDQLDSGRAVSPLRRADGAVEVDTSELSIDQVVDVLAELAARAGRD
ncbi:MAG TPA: (d)CMP kinase [Jatrophihabitans sp.]|nr:(d)CMP kinase [Jatrophihabitans sp.]